MFLFANSSSRASLGPVVGTANGLSSRDRRKSKIVADVWRVENEGGGNANEVRACSKVNSYSDKTNDKED